MLGDERGERGVHGIIHDIFTDTIGVELVEGSGGDHHIHQEVVLDSAHTPQVHGTVGFGGVQVVTFGPIDSVGLVGGVGGGVGGVEDVIVKPASAGLGGVGGVVVVVVVGVV